MHAGLEIRMTGGNGDRRLYFAALWIMAGALLSGPLGLLTTLIAPQPAWTDAAMFIANFHWWHQASFWFGFVFIGAWVGLNATLAAIATERYRARALAALVATGIYGAMIASNYLLQVAYVSLAVRANDLNVGYFTMNNPASFSWVLEMFGYGALGVSNWLTAPIFPGVSLRRHWIVWLMMAHGVIDVLSAVVTAFDVGWVMTPIGLAAYLFWNALVVVTAAMIALEYRPTGTGAVSVGWSGIAVRE